MTAGSHDDGTASQRLVVPGPYVLFRYQLLAYVVFWALVAATWPPSPGGVYLTSLAVLAAVEVWSVVASARRYGWRPGERPRPWAIIDQDALRFGSRYWLPWTDVAEIRLVKRRPPPRSTETGAGHLLVVPRAPVRLPWYRLIDRLTARAHGTPFLLPNTEAVPVEELVAAVEQLSGQPVRRIPPEQPWF